MRKLNVAYVCVHNSCRSQMAEAITKLKYNDYFNAYSAGTEERDQINQDAVKTIIEMYDFDMNESHHSKLVETLPEMDIVITMGCNVDCPYLPCKYREDWGLEDPSHKEEEIFELTAKLIDEKIANLKYRIELGLIEL